MRLSPVNLTVQVVDARASTIALVDNALGALRTAFRKVDGVIVNRRRLEPSLKVFRWLQR